MGMPPSKKNQFFPPYFSFSFSSSLIHRRPGKRLHIQTYIQHWFNKARPATPSISSEVRTLKQSRDHMNKNHDPQKYASRAYKNHIALMIMIISLVFCWNVENKKSPFNLYFFFLLLILLHIVSVICLFMVVRCSFAYWLRIVCSHCVKKKIKMKRKVCGFKRILRFQFTLFPFSFVCSLAGTGSHSVSYSPFNEMNVEQS